MVKDRLGQVVERPDGIALDGDIIQDGGSVSVTMLLTDGAPVATATEGERHAYVRAKLGAAADGKPHAFMDAAYRTLTGVPSAATTAPSGPFPMTDAQRAFSQRGVEAALADAASRQGPQAREASYLAMCDGMSAPGCSKRAFVDGAPRQSTQARDAVGAVRAAAYSDYRTRLSDAWKGKAA